MSNHVKPCEPPLKLGFFLLLHRGSFSWVRRPGSGSAAGRGSCRKTWSGCSARPELSALDQAGSEDDEDLGMTWGTWEKPGEKHWKNHEKPWHFLWTSVFWDGEQPRENT